VVKGSVTISIDDFQALVKSKEDAMALEGNVKLLAKELQVFLSFLCTRSEIDKYVEEFNLQSATSKITLLNGRAKIEKR
jgi:hypothetical protein